MRYFTYAEAVAEHIEIVCTTADILELVLSVESDQWELDEITNWVTQHTKPYP
jgi:hypothetical protein